MKFVVRVTDGTATSGAIGAIGVLTDAGKAFGKDKGEKAEGFYGTSSIIQPQLGSLIQL